VKPNFRTLIKLVLGAFLALAACESGSTPEVQEIESFSVGSPGNFYQGPEFDSCYLADPYEIVVIGKLGDFTVMSKDPRCDYVDHYAWDSFLWLELQILASTSEDVKVGEHITALVHDPHFTSNSVENYQGPNYMLLSLRNVEGKWVQTLKSGFAVLPQDAGGAVLDAQDEIHFPTDWTALKAEVLANQADYATLCASSEVMTGAEFEAMVLDQPPSGKAGCSTSVSNEAQCSGEGCDPYDGDDRY
jgi:hypothetical protein